MATPISKRTTGVHRTPLPAHVAERVLTMFDRCQFCGLRHLDISPRTHRIARLEVEHIVPVSRGGNHALWNLTAGCRSCNRRKGTKTAAEFGFPVIRSAAGIVRFCLVVH